MIAFIVRCNMNYARHDSIKIEVRLSSVAGGDPLRRRQREGGEGSRQRCLKGAHLISDENLATR